MKTYVLENLTNEEVMEAYETVKKRKNIYIILFLLSFVLFYIDTLIPYNQTTQLLPYTISIYSILAYILLPGFILFNINSMNLIEKGKTSNFFVRMFWGIIGMFIPFLVVPMLAKIEPLGNYVAGIRFL